MLSVAATAIILACTLLLFFLCVFIPIGFKYTRFWDAPDDHFISSRNTQSWWSIGFSLYAGAVGTWALTTPPETAITAGWWGLLGYAIACGCPWMIFLWSGAKLRKLMKYRGFTSLEFVLERFGRPMHIIVSLFSIAYLVLLLVSELIAIGYCLVAVCPSFPPLAATISVALVTNIYSALGGFPASMLTDKIQGVLTILLVVICYSAVFITVSPSIDADSWNAAMSWPSEGIPTALVLILSCFVVEQLNQATWQRIFAAKSDRDLHKGFILGVCLMFPSMIMFGMAGLFGQAASNAGVIDLPEGSGSQAMFLLLATLPNFWLGLVVFLAVGLVTSTADTIQTGLAAMISGELTARHLSLNWARIFSLVLNVPAVLLASFNPPSILTIMMLVNTWSVAVVPSVLFGFSSRVTPMGSVCAAIGGLLFTPIFGWIYKRDFVAGLKWGSFPDGYNWFCFATFVGILLTSLVLGFGVSLVQFYLYPELHDKQKSILESIQHEKEDVDGIVNVSDKSVVFPQTKESTESEKSLKSEKSIKVGN